MTAFQHSFQDGISDYHVNDSAPRRMKYGRSQPHTMFQEFRLDSKAMAPANVNHITFGWNYRKHEHFPDDNGF